MRFLPVLLVALSLRLFADFFPTPTQTTIREVQNDHVILASPLPRKGMSAVIVHHYGNGLDAIIGHLHYLGDRKARIIANEPIAHDNLPTIKTAIRAKDKVRAGHLYRNILLLAPDADTYARITAANKSKNWIHPDLYAAFLTEEGDQIPTTHNLAKFANQLQIGLIYIVQKEGAALYDPISRQVIARKQLRRLPKKGRFPFYMRLEKIESGLFSRDAKGTYYELMERFQ
jgi:hypothetical protein